MTKPEILDLALRASGKASQRKGVQKWPPFGTIQGTPPGYPPDDPLGTPQMTPI